MTLFIEKMGWEKREDTGEEVFRIVLVGEHEEDVPKLTLATIIDKRAVVLTEAAN